MNATTLYVSVTMACRRSEFKSEETSGLELRDLTGDAERLAGLLVVPNGKNSNGGEDSGYAV